MPLVPNVGASRAKNALGEVDRDEMSSWASAIRGMPRTVRSRWAWTFDPVWMQPEDTAAEGMDASSSMETAAERLAGPRVGIGATDADRAAPDVQVDEQGRYVRASRSDDEQAQREGSGPRRAPRQGAPRRWRGLGASLDYLAGADDPRASEDTPGPAGLRRVRGTPSSARHAAASRARGAVRRGRPGAGRRGGTEADGSTHAVGRRGAGLRRGMRGAADGELLSPDAQIDTPGDEPTEVPSWARRAATGTSLAGSTAEAWDEAEQGRSGALLRALARADRPDELIRVLASDGAAAAALARTLPGSAGRLMSRIVKMRLTGAVGVATAPVS